MTQIFEQESSFCLHHGDALEIMQTLPSNSVDLILTDPPYYKVKGESWDRQWGTAQGFLEWLGNILEQYHRLLKPNGSLYLFASPKMAARIEVLIGERFNVLNRITWVKPDPSSSINLGASGGGRACKEALRSFFPQTESIIFAEHYGADNIAKGEAGYATKCDELRGFVFEPLLNYLECERQRAGVSKDDINEVLGFRRIGGMAGRHYFNRSQWQLPTVEHYNKMRQALSQLSHGGEYLQRPYEDLRREYEDLRREYEDLRREYEDLRRPFKVSADVPYTDVWTFKTVNHYPGKHPCEKPLDMLDHIIAASSRNDAVVLDSFMGTGNTGIACAKLGRKFIGIDKTEKYFERARQRVSAAYSKNFKPIKHKEIAEARIAHHCGKQSGQKKSKVKNVDLFDERSS